MKKGLFIFTLLSIAIFTNVVYADWTKYDRSTTNSSITLSSVTAAVRIIIDDPNSTNGTVRYSSSTIYDLINTGQRLLCINTYCLTTYATQDLVANTTYYLLPDDCIAVERLTMDINEGDGPEYLPQTTVFHLDADKGTAWSIATDSPTAYFVQNRYLGLYPYPEYSGAHITLWYIKIPSLMDEESDYVFDGYTPLEPYWHALAAYAAYHILLAEGRVERLDALSSEYAGALESIRQWIRYKPDMELDFTGSTYNTK